MCPHGFIARVQDLSCFAWDRCYCASRPPRRRNRTAFLWSAARAVEQVEHLAGSHLGSNECEDLIDRTDSKHAGSGSDGNIFETTRNLDKLFGAGIESPDIAGCVDEPDAVPASRDLKGTVRYRVEGAGGGIVAKDLIGAVDSPYVIHAHGNL